MPPATEPSATSGIPAEQLSVVVPIYRATLEPREELSLESAFRVLGAHHFVLVKPAGLDTTALEARFPFRAIEAFEPQYFGTTSAYNRLLLSTHFYERFLASAFMLVCQLDVYVFRDDLAAWITKGYDYVGAPWVSGSSVGLGIHRLKMLAAGLLPGDRERVHDYETRNRVGNGGFSLRRVATHHRLSLEMKDLVARYAGRQGTHHFHEDVFWSIEPQRRGHPYRTPPVEEAMSFAWDVHPERLFALAGGRLPMAAHGWFKRRHLAFWEPRVAAARASATGELARP
jgi:hypothetical protein